MNISRTSEQSGGETARCAEKAGRIVPMLVWSGLGFCAAAATLYDLRDIVGW